MNLREIRQAIKSKSDYDPELTDYDREIDAIINEKYLWLFSEHPWSFAYKTTTITTRVDDTTGTVSVTNGSRAVTGSSTAWQTYQEGAYFVGPDGTSYEIGKVASTTSLYLSTPYQGSTASGQSYEIQHTRYALPADCVDYMGIQARSTQRGPLRYVDHETEAIYNLNPTDEGDPAVFFAVPNDARRTPDSALTAAVVAGGSLTTGTSYSYFYRWKIAGVSTGISPGPHVSITVTGGNTVRLTGFQECSATEPRQAEVFRANNATRMYYRVYVGPITSSTLDDTGSGTVVADSDAPFFVDENRKYIRFYPRPSTSEALEVRYHLHPPAMMKDSDVPILPSETHGILIDLALVEIYTKHSDQRAAIAKNAAATRLREMTSRYLVSPATNSRRGAWYGPSMPKDYNLGPLVVVNT